MPQGPEIVKWEGWNIAVILTYDISLLATTLGRILECQIHGFVKGASTACPVVSKS